MEPTIQAGLSTDGIEEQHDIALYRPGKMQAEDAQEIVEADIQISKTAYIK